MEDSKLFEQKLVTFLLETDLFNASFDELAAFISNQSGRDFIPKKVFYISTGQLYAKKWLLTILMETSLRAGWLPNSVKDWEHIIHTLTGKKQSVRGGDNSQIFRMLADIADKPEVVFQNNFKVIVEGDLYA
ncbi:hypothetical protein [Thalassotalea marina]|uniref:Uncharacterized protein n=1 Tax=Thalassotalea marina TaxID=1673741 RepID=A0A919BS08_9GAMM|nr:hypothetical protein [Thalassotalea marina]GHG06951.1 hypothetical protein GCM10017161_40700 [Thalassotalea marina]